MFTRTSSSDVKGKVPPMIPSLYNAVKSHSVSFIRRVRPRPGMKSPGDLGTTRVSGSTGCLSPYWGGV